MRVYTSLCTHAVVLPLRGRNCLRLLRPGFGAFWEPVANHCPSFGRRSPVPAAMCAPGVFQMEHEIRRKSRHCDTQDFVRFCFPSDLAHRFGALRLRNGK